MARGSWKNNVPKSFQLLIAREPDLVRKGDGMYLAASIVRLHFFWSPD